MSLKTVFTDGTKIEANANRYTFVWGRAIEKNKQRIKEQLEDLWQYTQEVAKIESKDKTEVEFKAIDKELVEKAIQKIDTTLQDKKICPKVRQNLTMPVKTGI